MSVLWRKTQPRRWRVKHPRRWVAAGAAGALAAFGMFAALPAVAVHDTGAFELDGNATHQTTDDWDNVCHQVSPTACPTPANTNGATAVSWTAEPNLNSTIFTGGGSKDPQDVSNWAWKDGAGGLPDKDNLLHSFAARYSLPVSSTCPAGTAPTCELIFFGSDRYDNSGDAQQGFWFFQNPITLGTTPLGGGTSFNGVHKDGDLLVISDFSNGGATSTITVYAWDHTCASAGSTASDGRTCGDANLKLMETSTTANCATAAAADKFCGIVNSKDGTTVPWSYTDKSGNSTYLQGEFFEGGINLSTLGLSNECFSTVASETRSSTSTTATLKDFVLGSFGKCETHVKTTPKDGSGNAIPSGGLSIGTGSVTATDSATVSVDGISTWTGSVAFSLCGPLTSAAGCTSGGTAIGTAKSVSNSSPTALSAAATITSAGTYCWRGDFTPSDASKTAGVSSGTDGSTTECFVVNPVTPDLSTNAGADVVLGNPVTDTATLAGTANQPGTPVINPTTAGGPAGGTITFTLYGPNDCTTVAYTSSAVKVSGDGDYTASFTPTSAGTYHWAASYSGNAPNTNSATHNTGCTDTNEDVVVQKVTTKITTAQKWLPNDSATISASGGGDLKGNVRFRLYDNNTCTGTPLYDSGSVAVAGTSPQTVSTSNTSVLTSSATVSWLVEYSSDNGNQAGVTSSCNTENSSLTITNG